jgi:hypothetical protein
MTPGPEDRPSFTVRAAAERPTVPGLAWGAAAFGVGAAAGAALHDPACVDWCTPGLLLPWVLSAGALASGAAWALAPAGDDARRALGAAALLALAAAAATGAAVLAPHLMLFGEAKTVPLFALAGLAAPAALLPALLPGATIAFPGSRAGGPQGWLRAGAAPAAAGFGGFALVGAGGWSASLAAPLALAAAGALLAAAARRAHGPPGPRDQEKGPGRLRRAAALTPMLRLHLAADAAVAFSAAAGVAVAAASPWAAVQSGAVAAVALGGAAGAALFAIGAPRIDAWLGRGRLLTLALACAAAAPLALLPAASDLQAGVPPSPVGLLAASAAYAFALASLPQRSALLFDLASSRARARVASDLQAVRLAAAALAVPCVGLFESATPGFGPLAPALVGGVVLAAYAPALGSLGAPRRDAPRAPG